MNSPAAPGKARSRRHGPLASLSLGLGALGTLLLSAITATAILHWGGAYPHMAAQLQLGASVLGVLLAACLALQLSTRRAAPDAVDACVLLFLLYAGWTYTRTPVEYTARLEWSWILTYAISFWFVRYGLPSRYWAFGLIGVVILAALASCIYAFVHRDNPVHLIWGLPRPNYGARISGTFGCPNHFANLMVMAALSCVFLGAYSRFAWPLRIFLFYLAVVLTAGLFLSVSRGGYIAWLAGMLVVAWVLFRSPSIRWWWKATVSLLVAAGTVLIVIKNPFVMDRLDKMMDGDIRIKLAHLSIRYWKNAPVWGQGIGAYDYVYLRDHGPDIQTRAIYAHCDYLNTLVDYGAVGLALILLFLLAVVIRLVLRGRSTPRERETLLLRLGWAALAAMAVHSLFDFSLHIPACALAFFVILGASIMRTPREERALSHGPAAWAARVGWAVFLLTTLAATATLASMAWKTHQGQQVGRFTQEQFRALDIAAIDAAGERLWNTDPLAYPLLSAFGNAFRRRAAEASADLESAAPEARPALLRLREEAGRLSLKYYQRAHRAAPLDDSLLLSQAMTLDILQRFPEAYLAYNRAIELRPHNRYFRYTFGIHLIENGQYEAALEQLTFAVQLPGDARENPEIRKGANSLIQFLQNRTKKQNPG